MASPSIKSDIVGFVISDSSHNTNLNASGKVRTYRNDIKCRKLYNPLMTNRRGIPKGGPNWFIKEWMDHLSVRQKDMVERCDWSKASASQIYNGSQDYSPKIVNEAAEALNVRPYELLMHPDQAMILRRLESSVKEIAELAVDNQDMRVSFN